MFLGAVCTVQDLNKLLVRKVLAQDVRMLEDGHAHLSPSAPIRTQDINPSTDEDPIFTQIWNWDCQGLEYGPCLREIKFADMTISDKVTLTYHLMQCLLRMQILSLRILGFTMKIIQPSTL